jgi:hypothetical protein
MRVELPGDDWAELRDPSDLRAKDKIAVQRAIVFSMQNPDDEPEDGQEPSRVPVSAGLAEDMTVAMLCRLITSWSLQPPAPVTAAVIEDLPLATYTALSDAIVPHLEAVRSAPNRRTRTASSG